MSALQIAILLAFVLGNVVILYFISHRFEKGWVGSLFNQMKRAEQGTDMGFMTVRMIVIMEAIAVFIITKGL